MKIFLRPTKDRLTPHMEMELPFLEYSGLNPEVPHPFCGFSTISFKERRKENNLPLLHLSKWIK